MARFSRVIPPGGEGWISLSVNTRNYSGRTTKSATVYSNDPENSTIRLIIRATIKLLIDLSKKTVYLRGNEGEEISATITVKTKEPEPLNLEFNDFTLSDKVRFGIEEIEEGKTFNLHFSIIPGLVGRHKGVLSLRTNYPQKPSISIPVLVQVNRKRELP
ncbi:MAG: hypothetical protein JW882_07540 [Deltaproteobacteria bacterium]|nr:hypothetical protein [Deltaproteobacteria bacterium]